MDSCSLFASTYKLNHRVSEAIQPRTFIKDPDNLQVGKECFVVLPLIESSILCSGSKVFIVTFSLLKLKIV